MRSERCEPDGPCRFLFDVGRWSALTRGIDTARTQSLLVRAVREITEWLLAKPRRLLCRS